MNLRLQLYLLIEKQGKQLLDWMTGCYSLRLMLYGNFILDKQKLPIDNRCWIRKSFFNHVRHRSN